MCLVCSTSGTQQDRADVDVRGAFRPPTSTNPKAKFRCCFLRRDKLTISLSHGHHNKVRLRETMSRSRFHVVANHTMLPHL